MFKERTEGEEDPDRLPGLIHGVVDNWETITINNLHRTKEKRGRGGVFVCLHELGSRDSHRQGTLPVEPVRSRRSVSQFESDLQRPFHKPCIN